MIRTAIVFDHRGRAKNGMGPVEIRITVDRKSYYITTGINVQKSNFTGGTIVNQFDAPELNERLRILFSKIQTIVNDMIENGEMIDVAEVRRKAWQIAEDYTPNTYPVLDWIDEQIPILGLKPGTTKHYITLRTRLHEYGEIKRWKDLTTEKLYAFDAWLHGIVKSRGVNGTGEGGKISNSAVYNYHKCLKALLNRAVKFGKLETNPYDRLRGEFKRGDKESIEYLTEEEVKRFRDTHPPVGSMMDVAHDLFIFQLYTGLAYSDTQAFDFSQYKNIDGKWINTGERIKTGTAYISQLLPPVVTVLAKYNWKVPKIGNAEYNRCLKALGMVAGIDTPLHSHLARHTFATFMLRNKVPIENLSRMLGHTNITQTQRYAKVLAVSVHEDFDRIADILSEQEK